MRLHPIQYLPISTENICIHIRFSSAMQVNYQTMIRLYMRTNLLVKAGVIGKILFQFLRRWAPGRQTICNVQKLELRVIKPFGHMFAKG